MSQTETALLACPHQEAAAQLIVAGRQYVADFTGHTAFSFDPNRLAQYLKGDANQVEMRIQEDVNNGVGAVIGAISWIMDPGRVPPPSTLTAISPGTPFPAVEEFVLNIIVEIPALLPGVRLRNKDRPAILRNANVTDFPPQNDMYQLAEPIQLEDVNNPGQVLATIRNFPGTWNPPAA